MDVLYTVVPDGQGGLTITDVSSRSRFDASGPSRQHGQAVGDYDRDGHLDVYCNNGGPLWALPTQEQNLFLRNRDNANAWTALEIEGVYSNRTGVGTVARASTSAGRSVYRTLQVGCDFSNMPDHALHFGIGNDAAVERIELRWPSGIVQRIDEPPMGTYTDVVETGALLRGTPTVGQSFSIDFAGKPGDLVELGFSSTTGTSEVDGVNGSFLLTGPCVLLPAVPLDAGGRRTLQIPLPDSPALVGLTIYAQAWIHAPGSGFPRGGQGSDGGTSGSGTFTELLEIAIQQ